MQQVPPDDPIDPPVPATGPGRRVWIALLVLTVLAAWIRVAYVQDTHLVSPIRADAEEYTSYGYHLQRHGVLSRQDPRLEEPVPDSFRAPGLPVMLALSFEIEERGWVGRWYDAVRGMLVLLGVLTVPLSYLLARRMLPPWAAVTVAGLVAFSPHLVAMTGYVLTETPFTFCLALATALLFAAWDRDRAWLWAAAGGVFGLAYLFNQTVGFVPFLVLAFLAWRRRRSPADASLPSVAGLALCLGVFLIAPVGWAARNHFNVPADTAGGSSRALATITHGSYPGFVHEDPRLKYYPYRDDPEQPEYSSSFAKFWPIFSRRVRERPLRYASWYLLEKPYWLWTWNILQGEGDVYVYPRGERGSLYDQSSVARLTKTAMRGLHPVLCLLALAAPILLLLEGRREGRLPPARTPVLVVLLVLAGYTALYTVFASWPRYTIPLRPLLYAAALWSAVTLWRGRLALLTSSPRPSALDTRSPAPEPHDQRP